MTDDQIRAAVQRQVGRAITGVGATADVERTSALDFYYGRPLGNEIPGRAQVVTRDLMDTIEWVMPSLLRVFTGRQAVEFDPVGPEDEELAKQETAYVSHVLWKKNDGFMLIYSWLKDALMQRVGYVKYYWDDEEKVSEETYTGLTQDQLVLAMQELSSRGEVEVLEAEAGHTGPNTFQTWDVKFKITSRQGKLCVEPIPPDEIIVSSDCRGSIKKASFVGHKRELTRSELMEMGFSRDEVKQATSFDWADSNAEQARDVSNNVTDDDDDGVDWASEELELLECVMKIDADGDGIAERRSLLVGGHGIMRNDVTDDVPYESWTPIPIPHKHVGLSFYDLLEDLQRIHTSLTRSLLDNTYFGVNQRLAYDQNRVSAPMLQINRPGGHVAVDGDTSGAITPIVQPDVAGKLLPVISHIGQMRQVRSGVGDMATGVDADILAKSTKGAYLDASNRASQRIEAIARIFAETGLSSLYLSMHKMLLKHQDWSTRFRLKDQYVEVNPTEWRERTNLTVSVGLGTAAREEVRANLALMAQAQIQAASVPGLIQPKNVYALFRRLQTEMGFEAEDFVTDPQSPEYQQFMQQASQQPDPEQQKIQAQLQVEREKAQLGAQSEAAKQRFQSEQAAQETQMEMARDQQKTEMEIQLEREKAAIDAGLEREKMGMELEKAIRVEQIRQAGQVEAAQVQAHAAETGANEGERSRVYDTERSANRERQLAAINELLAKVQKIRGSVTVQ